MIAGKKILVIGGNGYIGSYLVPRLAVELHNEITVLDDNWFGYKPVTFRPNVIYIYDDYSRKQFCNEQFLSQFDAIVVLAAHSSVKMSEPLKGDDASVSSAYHNNVDNLQSLIFCIPQKTRLIYMSSASIYACSPLLPMDGIYTEKHINIDNNSIKTYTDRSVCAYDQSKLLTEFVAYLDTNKQGKPNSVGLRLGTVAGMAPHFRSELIINSMVKSAVEKGIVYYANPKVKRAIALIEFVGTAIMTLINCSDEKFTRYPVYNICNINSTVHSLAKVVATQMRVDMEELPSNTLPTQYDFNLSMERWMEVFPNVVPGTYLWHTIDAIRWPLKTGHVHTTNRNQYREYTRC